MNNTYAPVSANYQHVELSLWWIQIFFSKSFDQIFDVWTDEIIAWLTADGERLRKAFHHRGYYPKLSALPHLNVTNSRSTSATIPFHWKAFYAINLRSVLSKQLLLSLLRWMSSWFHEWICGKCVKSLALSNSRVCAMKCCQMNGAISFQDLSRCCLRSEIHHSWRNNQPSELSSSLSRV